VTHSTTPGSAPAPSHPPTGGLDRRLFLGGAGVSLARLAVASLLPGSAAAAAGSAGRDGRLAGASDGSSRGPHFRPRAKRVIQLFMGGAPSQLELFVHKPHLTRHAGQPLPPSVLGDQRYAFIRPDAAVLGPRFRFREVGESRATVSEVLPHLAGVADRLTFVHSVHTDQFNHAPAQLFFQTGFALPERPSFGSWVHYGLGSLTDDLPAYVVLSTGSGLSGGAALYSSGFLPQRFSATRLRSRGAPILDLENPPGVDARLQADTIGAVNRLQRLRMERQGDPGIDASIASMELAARLQTSAPELVDLSRESAETLALYGCEPEQPSFARACLLARRMVERGVRFVTLYHEGWDAHSDVEGNVRGKALETDQACAALILDLERRGLLDDTLVVWGGEFGRTPMVETNPALGRALGRDHHPQAFTMWFAGGGMRAGHSLGATDDFGFHVVKDPVHVHDVQATLLACLGLDHERLTFRHAGRDFRLTDVHGRVVREMLA